ncbi:MAG: sialate O-acetylesterase [Mycobacteriales bacterium]
MSATDARIATPVAGRELHALAHHQVLQRESADGCHVQVRAFGPCVVQAIGPHGLAVDVQEATSEGPLSLWLPTGGPYGIVTTGVDGRRMLATDLLVGDLWVLAGQSNMEGCGRMAGREEAGPQVRVLDMSGCWRLAQEPLHLRWLSPHAVHARIDAEHQAEHAQQAKEPGAVAYIDAHVEADEVPTNGFLIGVGPGVSFANELVRRQRVPIGLIPAAHGNTAMAQWSPLLADDGSSLFGAMLHSVRVAGGSVTGVLWYQGENDADTSRPYTYDEELAELFAAMRQRTGNPDLMILTVQLGRFTQPSADAAFNAIWSRLRESQRRCPAATAVVSAVDLDLEDPIHLSTSGQLRLGRRLARVAAGVPGIDLAGAAVVRDGLALDVRFTGVVGRLMSLGGRPSGFSVRSAEGEDCNLVFAADLLPDGDGYRLRLSRRLQPGERLWYGYGADPTCNLIDEEDMAVPAFGPVELSLS